MDKLISADSLWMTIIHAMDYCEDILEFIEEEPEAVVRCKDCKFCTINATVMTAQTLVHCNEFRSMTKPEGYCYKGERR